MASQPTEGACEVAIAFHINSGSFGSVALDGLNAVLIARTPGAMAEGNWSAALYFDDRASEEQGQALQAIFSGSAGGPVSALSPLITTMLGAKSAPITFTITGKRRSVEIPNILHLAVNPLPSMDPNNEIWARNAHPFAPEVAMAVGESNSTWADYGMSWDNSGRNGHYASINWANA
jgi:hypothetical protein